MNKQLRAQRKADFIADVRQAAGRHGVVGFAFGFHADSWFGRLLLRLAGVR